MSRVFRLRRRSSTACSRNQPGFHRRRAPAGRSVRHPGPRPAPHRGVSAPAARQWRNASGHSGAEPQFERFAELCRGAKSDCLEPMVLLGEPHLRAAVRTFTLHYHQERPHQDTISFARLNSKFSRSRCDAPSDELSAGNLHATFCGSRERVTAPGDPVLWVKLPGPTRPRKSLALPYGGHSVIVLVWSPDAPSGCGGDTVAIWGRPSPSKHRTVKRCVPARNGQL